MVTARRRRSSRWRGQPDVNLNSFLDLILNVLLFFVFSTELVMFHALDVSVPVSADAEVLSRDRAGAVILIDRNNTLYADGVRMTAADLVDWLRQRKLAPAFDGVIVRGDLASNLQSMVDVLGACRRAQIDRIRLETETPDR